MVGGYKPMWTIIQKDKYNNACKGNLSSFNCME